MKELRKALRKIDMMQKAAAYLYDQEVQRLVNQYNVELVAIYRQDDDVWNILFDNEFISALNYLKKCDKVHPIFGKLEILDSEAKPFGIGPTNLQHYEPQRK